MTKAYSEAGDNGGRCERCNDPSTINQAQDAVPVLLGGGLGTGSMWLCRGCSEKDRPVTAVHDVKTDADAVVDVVPE